VRKTALLANTDSAAPCFLSARNLLIASLFAVALSWSPAIASPAPRSTTPLPVPKTADAFVGCCTDPDVRDFGHRIDFGAWPDGEEINTQFRGQGLLFGQGASSSAPQTLVLYDPSRSPGCEYVLNGEPAFSGWEFLIFVQPLQNKWAAVQRVGVDVGYCDGDTTCFIAAYDKDGNLLEAKFNDRVGFQFVWIERPTADISRVLVGDCADAVGHCYPDAGGSAFNCLAYSTPVPVDVPLPANIPMPPPPTVQGVPSLGPVGLAALSLALLGAAVSALWVRKPTNEPDSARGSHA
jgi:catechol 2,3-dioxygenase-like lactoylglutathione lyase family enzyme